MQTVTSARRTKLTMKPVKLARRRELITETVKEARRTELITKTVTPARRTELNITEQEKPIEESRVLQQKKAKFRAYIFMK